MQAPFLLCVLVWCRIDVNENVVSLELGIVADAEVHLPVSEDAEHEAPRCRSDFAETTVDRSAVDAGLTHTETVGVDELQEHLAGVRCLQAFRHDVSEQLIARERVGDAELLERASHTGRLCKRKHLEGWS